MITEGCITAYSEMANEFPLLTIKDEKRLLRTIHKYKTGKQRQEARELLFKSNIRLVMKQAYRYSTFPNIELDDLISAGTEGLIIAIDGFDIRKKTRLSTYAVPWIQLKIYNTLRSFGSSVYIPTNVLAGFHKYKKMTQDKMDDCQLNEISDKEIMKELKISKLGLSKVRMTQYRVTSLNQEIGGEKDSQGESTYESIIPDKNADLASEVLVTKEKREIINDVVKDLTPVQQDIIIKRYLTDKKTNLSSIGKKYKITGERVRQIERIALRKMRKKLKSRLGFVVR
jgi:RNA polymerase sigma factor (sigma-70 family)